jgi:hypothetical protein
MSENPPNPRTAIRQEIRANLLERVKSLPLEKGNYAKRLFNASRPEAFKAIYAEICEAEKRSLSTLTVGAESRGKHTDQKAQAEIEEAESDLYTKSAEKEAELLRLLERLAGEPVEKVKVPEKDYGALATEINSDLGKREIFKNYLFEEEGVLLAGGDVSQRLVAEHYARFPRYYREHTTKPFDPEASKVAAEILEDVASKDVRGRISEARTVINKNEELRREFGPRFEACVRTLDKDPGNKNAFEELKTIASMAADKLAFQRAKAAARFASLPDARPAPAAAVEPEPVAEPAVETPAAAVEPEPAGEVPAEPEVAPAAPSKEKLPEYHKARTQLSNSLIALMGSAGQDPKKIMRKVEEVIVTSKNEEERIKQLKKLKLKGLALEKAMEFSRVRDTYVGANAEDLQGSIEEKTKEYSDKYALLRTELEEQDKVMKKVEKIIAEPVSKEEKLKMLKKIGLNGKALGAAMALSETLGELHVAQSFFKEIEKKMAAEQERTEGEEQAPGREDVDPEETENEREEEEEAQDEAEESDSEEELSEDVKEEGPKEPAKESLPENWESLPQAVALVESRKNYAEAYIKLKDFFNGKDSLVRKFELVADAAPKGWDSGTDKQFVSSGAPSEILDFLSSHGFAPAGSAVAFEALAAREAYLDAKTSLARELKQIASDRIPLGVPEEEHERRMQAYSAEVFSVLLVDENRKLGLEKIAAMSPEKQGWFKRFAGTVINKVSTAIKENPRTVKAARFIYVGTATVVRASFLGVPEAIFALGGRTLLTAGVVKTRNWYHKGFETRLSEEMEGSLSELRASMARDTSLENIARVSHEIERINRKVEWIRKVNAGTELVAMGLAGFIAGQGTQSLQKALFHSGMWKDLGEVLTSKVQLSSSEMKLVSPEHHDPHTAISKDLKRMGLDKPKHMDKIVTEDPATKPRIKAPAPKVVEVKPPVKLEDVKTAPQEQVSTGSRSVQSTSAPEAIASVHASETVVSPEAPIPVDPHDYVPSHEAAIDPHDYVTSPQDLNAGSHDYIARTPDIESHDYVGGRMTDLNAHDYNGPSGHSLDSTSTPTVHDQAPSSAGSPEVDPHDYAGPSARTPDVASGAGIDTHDYTGPSVEAVNVPHGAAVDPHDYTGPSMDKVSPETVAAVDPHDYTGPSADKVVGIDPHDYNPVKSPDVAPRPVVADIARSGDAHPAPTSTWFERMDPPSQGGRPEMLDIYAIRAPQVLKEMQMFESQTHELSALDGVYVKDFLETTPALAPMDQGSSLGRQLANGMVRRTYKLADGLTREVTLTPRQAILRAYLEPYRNELAQRGLENVSMRDFLTKLMKQNG